MAITKEIEFNSYLFRVTIGAGFSDGVTLDQFHIYSLREDPNFFHSLNGVLAYYPFLYFKESMKHSNRVYSDVEFWGIDYCLSVLTDIKNANRALMETESMGFSISKEDKGYLKELRAFCKDKYTSALKRQDNKLFKDNRLLVFARDNGLCRYCGKELGKLFCVDHIVPRKHRGKSELENLALSCKSCNSKKGARTPEQAGMELLQNE